MVLAEASAEEGEQGTPTYQLLLPDSLRGGALGAGYLVLWLIVVPVLRKTEAFGVGGADKSWPNAYYLVSLLPIASLAYVGIAGAHLLGAFSSAEARLFHDLSPARTICRIQVGYQFFCILAGALCGPPLSKMESFIHHMAAGAAAVLSFLPYAHYYCIYFGALVEWSNIPLTVMDVFKLNRHLIKTQPGMYRVSRVLFAGVFLLLRTLIWPFFAVQMVTDVYATRSQIPLAGQIVTYIVLAALTALQLLWSVLVIRGLGASLRGTRTVADNGPVKTS